MVDSESYDNPDQVHLKKAIEEQSEQRLRDLFKKMPHSVKIILVSGFNKNKVYSQAARTAIRAVRDISGKIDFREFDMSHKAVEKYKINTSPTIMFEPERYKIKWLGAPLGEEGLILIEAILMIGFDKTELNEESRKILDSIKNPRDIRLFISPTCPYCPQQAKNALIATIERPELISLEIIDIQANPELAEKYNAFSTPTVYANDKLIAQGAQTMELFFSSLKKLEQQSVFIPDNEAEELEVDVVIVGGGPAGLTAGIYSARNGLKGVVVEKGVLGGQVATTPIVENYPGMTQVGGKTLVDIMVNHALQYVNIFPGEEVLKIQPGKPIIVTTSRRRFITRTVLLATGANYKKLDAPGEKGFAGRGVSYCSTCDGMIFKGKKVLMIGGGDSAVTEALHLKNIGVDVTLVHRRNKLRAQAKLVESLEREKIPVIYESEVTKISGREKVESVDLINTRTKTKTSLNVDGIFIAIGYLATTELAKRTGIEIGSDGYIVVDEKHRTNIPGIYCAGDVEGGYRHIVTAAGQGAEAALTIFEDLINPYWTVQAD